MLKVLKASGIVNNSFEFKEIMSFKNKNRNFFAIALNDEEFNMKKLSKKEYKLNDLYGIMMLSKYIKNEYSVNDFSFDLKKVKFSDINPNITKKYYSNKNDLIALKSGYFFMIFKKDDIPFFSELEKTNKVVRKDDIEYSVYSAPTWEIAQKVDNLISNSNLVYEIDDYLVNKNIKI